MKKEYEEKIKEMEYIVKNYDDIPDDVFHERCMREFVDNMEYLATTKDQEVLEHLLDFFVKDFDLNVGGVCETLETDIGDNFSLDQILKAFYKKYNFLANNNLNRCVQFSMWFIWHNKFEGFRRMFNTVKPELAEKIIGGMANWDDDHEYDRELNILREDMKTWEVKK